jgi:hypothetical protein
MLQADAGADLDFLVGSSGSAVSRESRCRRLTRPVGKKEFRLTRVDNEAAQEQTCEAIDRLAEALSYRTSS